MTTKERPLTAAGLPHLDVHGGDQGLSWRGYPLLLTASLVPRYLFTTASIDVLLDGRPLVRTGGQLSAIGEATDEFVLDGERHVIRLAWGQPQGTAAFPVTVDIDGERVAERVVAVRNQRMLLAFPVGLTLLCALAGLLAVWLAPPA